MEEKYYIIDSQNRECGAFNEDELNYVGLFEDSLIYCLDWSERKPLNQVAELNHIKRKQQSIKQHNSDYGKNLILIKHSITERNENEELVNPYSIKRKKVRIVVVCWLFFHSMILLMSSIGIQNESRFDSTDKFWPFVNFFVEGDWHPLYHPPFDRVYYNFNGLFYNYDFSEFISFNLVFSFVWFLLFTKKQL